MQSHHGTFIQALKNQFSSYLKPSSYHVDHRLRDVNGLEGLDYDLFILDRDCTLHGYHAHQRLQALEDTLHHIGPCAEIASNSSYEEVQRIRDVFGDIMPVSKLVKFDGGLPQLLRFDHVVLQIFAYDYVNHALWETTSHLCQGDRLLEPIIFEYKKPDPLILESVIDVNMHLKRIPAQPRVLMVGDSYLTYIVAGNLAGVDTAKVAPLRPITAPFELIAFRYLVDIPLGSVMSRLQNPSRRS
jgi:hypothetical protein